jgi:ArsR family transcriptional regulator, arsenate/arsenite/antimonite-responsive transcriptional repressor
MSRTSSPEQASATFQALSDPTRVRMLRLLASNETELCVCEFVDALQERQYNVSRQLKVLVSAGLVRGRKDGRWVYYSLCPAATAPEKHLRKLLAALEVDETLAQDQKRFERRMKLRTDGQCRIGIQTPSLAD